MNCDRIRLILSEFIDGELGEPDTSMVREHLSACPTCAREAETLRTVSGVVSQTSEAEPPPMLLARIKARESARKRIPIFSFLRPSMNFQWAGATVAVIVLLILGSRTVLHQSVHRSLSAKQPLPVQVKITPLQSPKSMASVTPMSSQVSAIPAAEPVRVKHLKSHEKHAARMARIGNPGTIKPGTFSSMIPEVAPGRSVASGTDEEVSTTPVVEAPAPAPSSGDDEVRTIKVVRAIDEQTKPAAETGTMEQLRERLRARNRERDYYRGANPRQIRECSVSIASVKF